MKKTENLGLKINLPHTFLFKILKLRKGFIANTKSRVGLENVWLRLLLNQFLCSACGKPNTGKPSLQQKKSLFTRQPSEETGEQI